MDGTVALSGADRALLVAVVGALEGYFRVDEMDPTGRAHALKHVARRAAETAGEDAADRLAAIGALLRQA